MAAIAACPTGVTQDYVSHVCGLARYYRQSPDQLNQEQVRAYLIHLIQEQRVSFSHYNATVCALRFVNLHRALIAVGGHPPVS